VGFEPTISAGERPKTYALDGAATGTGDLCVLKYIKFYKLNTFSHIGPLNIEIHLKLRKKYYCVT